MKKFIIAGIVAVIAAGGFLIINTNSNKKDENNTATPASTSDSTAETKKACELFTLDDAKTLIGSGATVVEGSGSANLATTESVTTDNCTYSADGATLGDLKQLTIQVQSGDSRQVKQAYENYQKEFPGDALPELGDTAYYATEAKQVNAFKNGVWVFVAGGSINAGDDANKELEIKAAKLVLDRL